MIQGATLDLHAVTETDRVSGVEHGEALVAFAEAAVAENSVAMAHARQRLLEAMGVEAMIDAAAVTSNFERMVRIADATGIPLDQRLETFAREVIDELDLKRFRAHDSAT